MWSWLQCGVWGGAGAPAIRGEPDLLMRGVLTLVRWAGGGVYGRQAARTQAPSSLGDSSSRAPIDSARSATVPTRRATVWQPRLRQRLPEPEAAS
jgi:hypothetical protein